MSAPPAAEGELVATGSWRPTWLVVLPVMALVVGVYWASFASMEAIWARSGTFAHAYLTLPIVGWLLWRQRAELRQLRPEPTFWVLPGLLAAGLLWMLGDLAGINVVTQFAAVGMLVAATIAVVGWRVARRMAFALGFLFFMVPFGEFAMQPMMDWTADVTVLALQAIGIPVYREGLSFVIPSGTWSVVEACSGVRYVIASVFVGSLYAYLNYRSLHRRLLFVGISLLVPIVANWLRAIGIVLLGHYSGNRLAVGVDHLIYGWVFFGLVIGAMYFIGARWREDPADERTRQTAPARVADAGAVRWALVALGAMFCAALPATLSKRLNPEIASPVALAAPAGCESASIEPTPVFRGSPSQSTYRCATPGGPVDVHVAIYSRQTYGDKLVDSQNMLVESSNVAWRQVESGLLRVDAPGGAPATLRAAELRQGGMNLSAPRAVSVRQVLWVDGQATHSARWATLLGLRSLLAGRGSGGTAVTLYAEGEDAAERSRRLDAFVRQRLPAFLDTLPTGARR